MKALDLLVLESKPVPATKLYCSGVKGCADEITHIDHKGWVYCLAHGLRFKQSRPCRKLTKAEMTLLLSGNPIKRY